MDSENELTTFKMETRPRKLPPPKFPKKYYKPNKSANKRKNNRISSPEIESITSATSEQTNTSNNTDVFLARSKQNIPRTTKLISEDEISNISTLDDQHTETEISEDFSESQRLTEYNSHSPKASDSKSYRDKLKERFRSVKQLSSQNLGKSSLKTFRNKSQDVVNLNKCIDNLRNDNHNINLQLKAHKRYVYQGEGEVSSAEKYQFFCESLLEVETIEEEADDDLEDDRKYNNVEGVVVVDQRAENMKELLVKSYEELIWSPKEQNLTHDLESTNNTENVISVVSKPPKIPQRHLRMLKARLLASENNSEFFDTSGNLKFAESNYSAICYRPDRYSVESPFELTYQNPSTTVPVNISAIIVKQTHPILEINIQGFRFTSHPLFSTEHVLQEKLIRHFDLHTDYRRNKKREELWQKLQSLRKEKIEIKEIQNAGGDAPHNLKTSTSITKEIKAIRAEFYLECKTYRDNVKKVLTAWKALKQLRADNNYSTTTIKLIITKLSESDAFYDDPTVLLNELITEKEEEYQEKLTAYKEELQTWRKQLEDEDNDNDVIEEEKPIKPPRTVSAKKLRSIVENMINESFGDSGEPTLGFSINYSHEITPDEEVNEDERVRRKSVANTKVRLKLKMNNVLICKSKTCKLNTNFTLNFDEVLSLKLLEYENVKENITIQLIEEHLTILQVQKTVLCTAEINIPRLEQLIGQTDFQEVQFNAEIDVHKDKRLSGFLTFCIGWDSVVKSSDNNLEIEDDIIVNEEKHQDKDLLQVKNTKCFRLDPYLDSFTICTKEDIDNNVRLQLLILRDKNEPEFVGMMVPNRLNEIPSNIFATYKRRLAEEKYQEYFDKEDEIDDDVISKRSVGRKYLRQIHTKVFQICRNCENNLSFEDIIDEKMVPWIQNYLKTMLSNFINWFKLIPALTKPLPLLELRSEVECLNSNLNDGLISAGKAKIVIYLKCGINLPIPTPTESEIDNERKNSGRKFSKSSTNISSNTNNTDINRIAKYFVEISYENIKVQSGLSHGKNPSWNEQLSVPLQSENLDYLNPNSLKGLIFIHLFQQVVDEDNNDDNEHNKHKISCLGFVVISIAAASAATSDNKLEGEFPLKTPPFIYGYEKEEERLPSTSTPRAQNNKLLNLSFLEMSIHVDSTVPKISADLTSISCGEPAFIRDHVLEWNKRFNLDHPRRKFSALAIDSNGKTICVTRFIRPLEPPKLNTDEFDVSWEQCARFVSLLPFSNVNKFYENVWLTGEQVLKLGIGSIYDHATLLTCYLLSLKMDVWLLFGFGIPHGNTAYVLIREYNETPLPNHFIIDVNNAIMYNVTDQYCPLKKVYCVVNENNIWGNVQRGDAVFTTRFDFTRRFDWQPLFNNSVSSPSNSVQHSLHYLQSGDANKLQNVIEKKLHRKIAKIRDQDVTIWNHYLCNLLKAQINKAEKNFMHGKTFLGSTNQIVEYSKNFKINGTIQCLQFSSVNEVIEAVLQTKTWNITGSNVEFASCVQVHAYVNQVIAVWIAFVSVVKK